MGDAKTVRIVLSGSPEGAIRAMREVSAAGAKTAHELGAHFDTAAGHVGGAFQRLGASLSNWGLPFGDSIAKIGDKFHDTEGKGKHFGSALAEVGKVGLMGIAGGVTAIGVESIKMAAEFDKSTSVLVTAAGESSKQLGKVRQGILDIASSTGTTWQNLTDGMYTVEKAGYRGADGLMVLKAAAQGAAEEGAQLSDVTNAMTSVMASYHLKASDSVMVMNEIKTAAGEGKLTMEEFSRALSTVIPVASANKVSFAEVGGAIATLTQHGTSAQEATMELSNAIRNLSAPNHVAATEMQQLGINVNDLSTRLGERGLTGTFGLLVSAITKHMGPAGTVLLNAFTVAKAAAADATVMMGKMPKALRGLAEEYAHGTISLGDYRKAMKALPVDQANLMGQFVALENRAKGFNGVLRSGSPAAQTFTDALKKMTGGSTGMNVALMLTGENMKGFKERTDKIAQAAKHAGKDVDGWAQTQKLFAVQMSMLHQTINRLAITIGEKLIPYVQSSILFFIKHKQVALDIAAVFGGVLLVSVAAWVGKLAWGAVQSVISFGKMIAGGIGWAASTAVSIGETLVLWGMYAAETVASAAVAVGAWVASMATMVSTAVAAGAAMLAAMPMWAIVALIVVVAALIFRHWHTLWRLVKHTFDVVWHAIRDTAITVWHALSSFFVGAWHVLVAAWHALWTGIKDVFSGVWHGVVVAAKIYWGIMKAFYVGAWHVLVAVWHALWIGIKDVFAAVWQSIRAIFEVAWNGIKAVFGFFKTQGTDILTGTINFFKSAWDTVWNGVKTVVQDVWNFIKPIFDAIGAAVKGVMDGISAVAHAAGNVGHAASNVGHALNPANWFADGGIVTGPTLAMVGEAGPEVILPLSKPRRMQELIAQAGITGLPSTRMSPVRLAGGGGSGDGGRSVVVNSHPVFHLHGTPREMTEQMQHLIERNNAELVRELRSA